MNIFENKKVLVTGATGLLGTHIVRRLLEVQGCHITALGRNIQKLQYVYGDYQGAGALSLHEGDVAVKMPSLGNSIDYIFHAASPIAGDVIKTKPVCVIKSNISGMINCLDFLRDQGKGRMVVFSSATVYSNTTNTDYIASEENTSVADTLDAQNAPYSESKRMSEVIAKSYYKEFGVESLIARFSYLYGYTKLMPNTAFYEFIKKLLSGEDIVLNGSGIPRRDNIHVDDAVRGLFVLCEKGLSGESYNISSNGDKGNFAAIDEIADIMVAIINRIKESNQLRVIRKTGPCVRRPGLRLDNRKIKELGWHIEKNLEDGLYQTIQRYNDVK